VAEHLELARRIFEVYADNPSELPGYVHPEGEWHPVFQAGLERRSFSGPEGVRAWLGELTEVWAVWDVRLEAIDDVDGAALIRAHVHAVARASRVEFDRPVWLVFRIRDGKLVYGRPHFEREDALADAGRGAAPEGADAAGGSG
jgi:hypothetical protein